MGVPLAAAMSMPLWRTGWSGKSAASQARLRRPSTGASRATLTSSASRQFVNALSTFPADACELFFAGRHVFGF